MPLIARGRNARKRMVAHRAVSLPSPCCAAPRSYRKPLRRAQEQSVGAVVTGQMSRNPRSTPPSRHEERFIMETDGVGGAPQ